MASTSGVAEAATRSLPMSIRRSLIHCGSMYVKNLKRLERKKGPAPCEERALLFHRVRVCASVVQREIEPHEPGSEDRGRIVPGPAVGSGVGILRLIGSGIVRVQQVLQVDADIDAPHAEPEDLREPHVDLISAGV